MKSELNGTNGVLGGSKRPSRAGDFQVARDVALRTVGHRPVPVEDASQQLAVGVLPSHVVQVVGGQRVGLPVSLREAEPVEQATASRSRFINRASARQPGKERLSVDAMPPISGPLSITGAAHLRSASRN